MPLRERRRRFTQNEIARVAIALFDERGFDDVTVEALSSAAGISSRTFFRYFSSKEDVVVLQREVASRRLLQAFERRPNGEAPVRALRNAFLDTCQLAPAVRATVMQYGRVQIGTPSLNAKMEGLRTSTDDAIVIELARRLGVDPSLDWRPDVVAAAMRSAAVAAFRRWVLEGGSEDPALTMTASLDLLLDGLVHVEVREVVRGASSEHA